MSEHSESGQVRRGAHVGGWSRKGIKSEKQLDEYISQCKQMAFGRALMYARTTRRDGGLYRSVGVGTPKRAAQVPEQCCDIPVNTRNIRHLRNTNTEVYDLKGDECVALVDGFLAEHIREV